MSTITINCSKDTYVSIYSKNTNHAGASQLITSRGGVIGKTSYQTALLQFVIPKAIQYKKIIKAVLHCYCGVAYSSQNITNIDYTPYLIESIAENVTYSNVSAVGTLGEKKTVVHLGDGNCWVADDITDIFANNLCGETYSLFVGMGNPTPDDGALASIRNYIGGISGNNGSYLTITYEDVEQLPPTITYPADVYVRQGEPVLFSWVYNSLTAAVQASATLEWKAESATEYNVIMLNQTAQSYMADIEFPAGTIDWRIKVTNDAGETSVYSEAKFVVIGKPSVPIITEVKNRALTEITWNASDQCVYEIAITDEAGNVLISEMIHSGETTYRPQMFLANGIYNIRLRTKNSIELWSDYISKTITINAVAPVQPTLSLLSEIEKVTIIAGYAEGVKAAVLRSDNGKDFEVITILEAGATDYVDDTVKAGKTYTYKIRAYAEGYTDSASRSVFFDFEGIYLQGEGNAIHLTKSEDTFLTHSEALSGDIVLNYYSGRMLPVVERGEHKTRKIQKKAFITFDEKELFENIVASGNVFYRDSDGNAFACAVGSPQYTRYQNAGYHVSFEITEVEREGVVINV